MLKNITLGADPELFIINTKTQKIISSIGIIPGEKGNAYTEGLPKGFGLQVDNILAEFNVPPVKLLNKEDFIGNIVFMLQYIKNFVQKINPDYGIYCAASANIDPDQLDSPEAQLFGCCPDYNAYTEEANEVPEGTMTNLRTTGFHIHIGYNKPNVGTSLDLIKYLDMYLGVPSVLLDKDFKRRDLYGKAGCYRITSYGVEYRVLSGFFIRTPKEIEFVYNQIIKAITAFNDNSPLAPDNEVIEIINTGDALKALKLINTFNI